MIDFKAVMRVFKLNPIDKKDTQGICVAIGIFDGVHLGHQKILRELLKHKPSGIITFYKHPRTGVKLIQTFSQRISLLKVWGINFVFALSRRDKILEKSTDEFIKDILLKLNINKVIVGSDFRLGHNRDTNVDQFKAICLNYGIIVKVLPVLLEEDNKKLSSTEIRSYIMNGDLVCTNKLLGRAFKIRGMVLRGSGLGKKIGFSTANMVAKFLKQAIPASGVYKTRTTVDSKTYNSYTYIGTNPTLKTDPTLVIETHIPGFNKNLYGSVIDLEFIKRIREEKKFSSVADLIKAIKSDLKNVAKKCIKFGQISKKN